MCKVGIIYVKVFKNGPSKNLRKTAFKKFDKVCQSRTYHFKFFKRCVPQVHSWITWPIWYSEMIILWLTTCVRLMLSFKRKKVPIFSALALHLCLFSRLHHILTQNCHICYPRILRIAFHWPLWFVVNKLFCFQ